MCQEHATHDQGKLTGPEDLERTSDGGLQDAQALVRPGLLAAWGIAMVRFYQRALSPLLPPMCRYRPTCSSYMVEALRRYGFFKGGYLGLKRLLRCHPLRPGGYDPVP